ncbi:MAG: DUF1643 domain-containing protein [Spirochaetes bacterium]|nr:DUF1643 domain-containing protein [Spirochaetota bacterium]
MNSGAVLSGDGKYRYSLTRRWGHGSLMVWCMLNPSTADENQDDPTIRRCMRFALREGYDGIHVVNLMSYRATNPMAAIIAADPFGPENDRYQIEAAALGDVVCAWGALASRAAIVRSVENFRSVGARLLCLGTTRGGQPRHPLYLRADTPLAEWRGVRIRP